MNTVRSVLENKGYSTFKTPPEAELWSALQLMARRNVGALLVMQDDTLQGILTERDYVWRVARERVDVLHIKVAEVMNPHVDKISASDSLDDALSLLREHHVHHLVVMDGDRVEGLISVGDVNRALLQNQSETIEELKILVNEQPPNLAF